MNNLIMTTKYHVLTVVNSFPFTSAICETEEQAKYVKSIYEEKDNVSEYIIVSVLYVKEISNENN